MKGLSMIGRITLTFALAASAGAAHAQVQLVPAQSEIVFTTRQMGVPVEGRFGRFAATFSLDPKKPEAGSVAFTIDTTSARFGTAELDAEVGKPEWLNTARFQQASFQSNAIKAAGPGRFQVSGRLAMKGVTQDLVVPVQLVQSGSGGTASGSFTLRRLGFKVGEGEWADTSMLADEVAVRFKLALSGLPPP